MMDEVKTPKLAIGQQLFFLACALLIGFVAGRSVAEAAGAISLESNAASFDRLNESDEILLVVARCLLALFVFASFRFLFLLGKRGVAVLAGLQTRPTPWVAVAIIICGVLCLLSAVILQWHESSASASVSTSLPSVEVSGLPRGVTNAGAVAIRTRTSLMAPVTTVAVLLAGLVIIAVGVWGSIPPRSTSVVMQNGKTEGIQAQPLATLDRPLE